MNLEEMVSNAASLLRVEGVSAKNTPLLFEAVALRFEGGRTLYLSVNVDDDTLRLKDAWQDQEVVFEDIGHPCVQGAYGLFLAWAWEMTNTKGYLDALQLEFRDASLKKSVILQFKAGASFLQVFEVRGMG